MSALSVQGDQVCAHRARVSGDLAVAVQGEVGKKVGPRLRELHHKRLEGVRRRDSRNLGPTILPIIPVGNAKQPLPFHAQVGNVGGNDGWAPQAVRSNDVRDKAVHIFPATSYFIQ